MLSTATHPDPHEDCWTDGCGESDCPAARRQRERDAARAKLQAPKWGELQAPVREGDYWRLEGQQINCSTALELQAIQTRADDYGEFTVYLPHGVRVRFELGWDRGKRVPVLYASVGGHEAVLSVEPWMRFRWPERAR